MTDVYDEDRDDEIESGKVLDPIDQKPRLCSRQCDTCVFRPGNVMRLRPGRLRQMVRDTLAGGGFIPCHETIRRPDFRPAVCRGFSDQYGHRSNLLRIWDRLGGFREVDPPGVVEPAEARKEAR